MLAFRANAHKAELTLHRLLDRGGFRLAVRTASGPSGRDGSSEIQLYVSASAMGQRPMDALLPAETSFEVISKVSMNPLVPLNS
jgi:hypothetical protein